MRIRDWSSDVCSSDLQEGQGRYRPEHPARLVGDEIADEPEDGGQRAEIDHMPHRQDDRLARHVAVQFEERDHRTRESDRADRYAEPHPDPDRTSTRLNSSH